MGAYTGFEPFFYDGTTVAFVSNPQFLTLMERCYSDLDSAAPTNRQSSGSAEQVDASQWFVSDDVNPLDDSKTTTASIIAKEGTSRWGDPVRLIARCRSNSTDVFVVWGDYLGDDSRSVYDEYKNVEVRVGEAEARSERWTISTDKEATFSPASIDLLRRMVEEDRVVLQTTPYNESPVTAVFDITGARAAIEAVAKTCNWQL